MLIEDCQDIKLIYKKMMRHRLLFKGDLENKFLIYKRHLMALLMTELYDILKNHVINIASYHNTKDYLLNKFDIVPLNQEFLKAYIKNFETKINFKEELGQKYNINEYLLLLIDFIRFHFSYYCDCDYYKDVYDLFIINYIDELKGLKVIKEKFGLV